MTPSLSKATLAGLMLAVMAMSFGCADDEAAQLHTDKLEFEAAMAKIESIPDYVAFHDMKGVDLVNESTSSIVAKLDARKARTIEELQQRAGLQQMRQRLLDDAAKDMSKVLSKGPKTQQVSALQLLSETYASFARQGYRDGITSWTEVLSDAGRWISHVTAIDITDNRARQFEADVAVLQEQLDEYQAQTGAEINGLNAQAAALNTQIAGLEQQIADLTTERDKARTQSHTLREEAASAKGGEQFNLYKQAIELERESTKAAAAMDKLKIRLDALKQELTLVDGELAIMQGADTSISTALTGAAQRKAGKEQEQTAALTEIRQSAADLDEAFTKLDQLYTQAVDQKLDEAAKNMAEAVSNAKLAKNKATGEIVRALELGVVGQQVEQVNMLLGHVEACAGYGELLSTLTARAKVLGLPQAKDFHRRYREVQTKQAELAGQAEDIGREAATSVQQFAQAGAKEGDSGAIAARHGELLADYQKRLKETLLPAEVPVGDARAPLTALPDEPELAPQPGPMPRPGTGQPGAGQPGLAPLQPGETVDAIAGDVPPLPDFAYGPGVTAIVRFDMRQAGPQTVNETVAALLGEATAEQLQQPLMMFAAGYKSFAQAGGTSVALLLLAPTEDKPNSDPIILISTKPGASEEAIRGILPLVASDIPFDQLQAKQDGQWITYHMQGAELPPAAEADRKAQFEEALTAHGDAAITIAVLIDEAARQAAQMGAAVAGQQAGAAGAGITIENVDALLKDMGWASITVKLGDEVGLYLTARYTDEAAAAAVKASIDEQIAQAFANPPDAPAPNPFAPETMIKNALRNAIKVGNDADKVSVSVAGDGLKAVGKLAGGLIGAMMQQGGPGAAPGDEPPVIPGAPGEAPEEIDPLK